MGEGFYTVADDKGFLLVGWVVPVKRVIRQLRCSGEFFICSAITHQWFSLPSSPPEPFVVESVGFVTLEESERFLTTYKVVVLLLRLKMLPLDTLTSRFFLQRQEFGYP
ncbi:OLC1v1016963C1 [Oldenlandia corymbosa var. corymbosa]|uniref:OLC1v1016963C1 n=1 Tax=Oldenlandia corymbosa var. corymbosa TaxID=529605 RepID=A0AAV1E8G8_OLDCO|nr:OLC1v1016963C1 [Oldenlandia corymbosa var. corymbosa]